MSKSMSERENRWVKERNGVTNSIKKAKMEREKREKRKCFSRRKKDFRKLKNECDSEMKIEIKIHRKKGKRKRSKESESN